MKVCQKLTIAISPTNISRVFPLALLRIAFLFPILKTSGSELLIRTEIMAQLFDTTNKQLTIAETTITAPPSQTNTSVIGKLITDTTMQSKIKRYKTH